MATNKQASIRYNVLDICLSNRYRKYTFNDLLNACNAKLAEIDSRHTGISTRTLRDDLKYMRSAEGWNAPIESYRDGQTFYYRYSDPNYSINQHPLRQDEVEQLKAAMEVLSRFEGLPQFEWVNELIPTLTQTFLLEKDSAAIIGFDSNQFLKGKEHIGSLFYHIRYKNVLKVVYQSFNSDQPTHMIIHPYYLRQYNNRWFLFGWNSDQQKISILALDRIIEFEAESNTLFVENISFNAVDYFEDIVGVSRIEGLRLQHIVLFFSNKSAPYVLSKPLHGSQRIVSKSKDGITISIDVIPNYELETLILSHGERVKVLEPIDFRTKIENRWREALGLPILQP